LERTSQRSYQTENVHMVIYDFSIHAPDVLLAQCLEDIHEGDVLIDGPFRF
jgi:hypothetical protein